MAQEHSGPQAKAPWTKIFTAFKLALDTKKLALAAAGIFFAWVGWWAIGWTFYGMRNKPVYVIELKEKKDAADLKAEWDRFKASRESWNLLHELAGSYSEKNPVSEDAADVTNDRDEYLLLHDWEQAYQRITEPIVVKDNTLEVPRLESAQKTFKLRPVGADENALKKLQGQSLTVQSLVIGAGDKKVISIDGVLATVEEGKFDELKKYRDEAMDRTQIAAKARLEENQKVAQKALETFKTKLVNPKIKKAGLLRISPWSENRGGNPYLIVSEVVKTRGESLTGQGKFLNWLVSNEMPVLLEPLVKFLLPIVFLFDDRAGGWDRLYLVMIMLWTLVVWGFFGGAICRIAAVQVARNERITLREAILFTKERFASYLAAPVFPMVLVGILTLLLMIFGWITWVPYLGEILAGLLWPLVILIGFIMAIVLVGLVGWPMMTATISTEGTDSFDALSRSYSYIYQAPWQYLWYNFLAVVYGAALVFFVGFMASLMIFLGKWGVSSAAGLSSSDPKSDREPSYLFYYTPTSFGWRDLLISNSQWTVPQSKTDYDGRKIERREFTEEYEAALTGMNRFGAVMVSVWIYPLFLLVVGFGYSYFWSASTIVYFLMRRHVDDTEMDEVHLEDEAVDDPFLKTPPPSPAAPPISKPGTLSLNVVEAPPAAPASYATGDPPVPPPENPK